MARKTVREPQVDGYLLLSFAKTDRLHDLEDFLAGLNVADVSPTSGMADFRSWILVRNVTTRNCTRPLKSSSPVSPTGLAWRLLWSISANTRMQSTVHAKPTPLRSGSKSTKRVSTSENSVLLRSVVST